MFKQMKKKQEGFTLVELIVVIAILGVLATLLVPNIMGNVAESKRQTVISNARTIASEITTYNAMQEDTSKRIKQATCPNDVLLVHKTEQGDWDKMKGIVSITVDASGNASVNVTPKAEQPK